MSANSLVVIGCGNPNRSDDGVGPEIVDRLRRMRLPDRVDVHDTGTDGMGVIYRARGASHVVIVDATAPAGEPGAIYDVPGELLRTPPKQSFTLHDFRWDHALYAGRKLYGDDFAARVRVFLVEAQSLDLGVGLSAAVARSAAAVTQRIEALADAFAAGQWI